MANENSRPTYAFEHVAARLEPFDLLRLGMTMGGQDRRSSTIQAIDQARFAGVSAGQQAKSIKDVNNGQRSNATDHALFPIFESNGLVFPYNPQISESISVKYDAVELTHTNESVHVYRGTDNTRITIGEAVWTCDTFDNAVYAMSVIHFFRTYSQMDFGAGKTGRPPSPMWFSAYGNYAFHRVPVLMEKADWTFPPDVDYVGIPEFGSFEHQARKLKFKRDSSVAYTWLPMKFTVSSISLVVQHSPRFWTNWDLDSYRSGNMVRTGRKSFHVTNGSEQSRKGKGAAS
jgi:hypothetical protein